MNVMFNILSVLGWVWTPVAFAVWGTAVHRRRQNVPVQTLGTEAEPAHES